MAKKDYIYVHGKPIHAKKLKEACEFNKGCSQYITARKKAAVYGMGAVRSFSVCL